MQPLERRIFIETRNGFSATDLFKKLTVYGFVFNEEDTRQQLNTVHGMEYFANMPFKYLILSQEDARQYSLWQGYPLGEPEIKETSGTLTLDVEFEFKIVTCSELDQAHIDFLQRKDEK